MNTSFLPASILPVCAFTLAASSLQAADSFEKPFRAEMAGEVIDVEIGHAAPLAADFDEDGRFDLLVGQFGGGRLRIYRNVGENSDPKFEKFGWFKTGFTDGTVPSG